MGYSYRNNGQIKDFWPDDSANEIYKAGAVSIQEAIELAQTKWGYNVDLSKVEIVSENIHTSCLTYDLYDPSDYTEFTVIKLRD